jgi:HEAT repeat protein
VTARGRGALGRLRRLGAVALLALLLPALPSRAKEKSFAEARAAMLKGLHSSDPGERARAVYELDGFDDGATARALARFVLARDDRERVIRAGIQLVGAMRSKGALEVLSVEAEKGDWAKRARVLEALGKWRCREVESPILLAAYDKDPRVRISALLALEDLPGGRADLALSDALGADLWPVRSAAIYVLRQRKSGAGVEALIERLEPGREEGRLLDDVHGALVRITGRDLGLLATDWRRWYRKSKGLEPEEPPAVRPAAPEPRVELAGVRSRARRVLFVVALNQSMNDAVRADGAKAAPADVRAAGGEALAAWSRARTKLDYARLWLGWAIDHLAPDVAFEVVTYGASANATFSGFVPASLQNRAKAGRRVLSLSASGNASLYSALRAVFTVETKDPVDPDHLDEGAEVVYFLTDGTSDTGEIRDAYRAFEEAEAWDRYRQIRFFAFGVGGSDTRVIADLGGMGPGGVATTLP